MHSLELELGGTTVLIGPNNAGKSAILEAVRILLTPRWRQRGTEFTENDVHRIDTNIDPRDSPPIRITLVSEESSPSEWHRDILADLDEVASLLPDGRNMISLQLTATWSQDSESFASKWQFLDADGNAHSSRRNSIYRPRFLNYLPLHWLAALRDASNQFTPRSTYWGRLLKSIRIPRETEESALQTLEGVDDFQQSGNNAGTFATIADAFQIPWDMIIDNDHGGDTFVKQILKRGFDQRDVDQRVVKMPAGTIEDQLIADGNDEILKKILNCPQLSRQELLTRMKDKVQYASAFSARITTDPDLAERMPQQMVHLVRRLRKECV